ncbi:hypothetical protein IFM89_035280 [Coptis chinensis]|uniref:mitogen-activated protein kinase kinase kinase n=1 Tax=Coptis chinensis TaxID=261450 RepID=A0A835H1G5_9MAGN|nr:hypothetical protein IFM89_035280 [Coptis chinensis]
MDWTRGHSIGHGASATVSVGKAHRSNEVFAVKSVELSKSDFLQREQRILSSVRCPQIVGYLGCDVTNESGTYMYNLFMEYVSGGALSDSIQSQGGCLDECAIRSHTRDILHGLDYLHMNQIVHCDIKGKNVLIGSDGAKIADLGCSKWVNEFEVSANPIAGTPVFMAPEVASGEEQSFPADIWALGCTVIEMATGSPPWKDAKDPVSALYRIAFSGDVPEVPSFLSEQAKDFLEKCFVKNPKKRWTSSQLLKHPFLENTKRIQNSVSCSPTSILDQDFWDSIEESDTPRNLSNIGCSSSAAKRLQCISSPAKPNWALDEKDEDWITIRSNETDEKVVDDFSDEYSTISAASSSRQQLMMHFEPLSNVMCNKCVPLPLIHHTYKDNDHCYVFWKNSRVNLPLVV